MSEKNISNEIEKELVYYNELERRIEKKYL